MAVGKRIVSNIYYSIMQSQRTIKATIIKCV